jgi:histidinol-phosphatase
MTTEATDLELALELADQADGITTAAFRKTDLIVETKADRTPVSEADRAVEREIRAVLATRRPGDRVVGEEYGDSGPAEDSNRRWIVDPIDGTKNFVRRIPVWATLLALEVDGRIELGVVSAPALHRRWWAGRGRGAWAEDTTTRASSRIHVSQVADLSDAHLSGGALSTWDDPQRYVELALRCFADRNLGDFWSHVLVAEGACDIGLDPTVSLWDLAALQPIVEEAGGRFTDFNGQARADGGSAISSNGLLHDKALAILTKDTR